MNTSPGQLPPRVRMAGARFWTADPARPWANSLLLDAGRIIALDAPAPAGVPTVTLPAGSVVTPGLIDAHLHLSLGAHTLAQLDLSTVRSRT
ncbi:MAG: hypothetical protein EBU31_13945, partial [Proteobacteria bacterium]|nr:hypothetical protein [Pseudomonadota bacterium]